MLKLFLIRDKMIITPEFMIIFMLVTLFIFLLSGYPVAFTISGVPLVFALIGHIFNVFDFLSSLNILLFNFFTCRLKQILGICHFLQCVLLPFGLLFVVVPTNSILFFYSVLSFFLYFVYFLFIIKFL